MAFKLKGFNPGEGTGMGSAFTKISKTRQKKQEIQKAMYKEDDAPNEPTRYSKEQQQAGAGSSREFFRKEGGDTKTKKDIKRSKKQKDTKWGGKTGDVVTGGGMKNTLYVDEEAKTDRKGKIKKTKYKDTAKKGLFGKKRTIKLDSYGHRNLKQEKASKQAEKEGKDPSLAANPYKDVGEAQFTGEGSGKKTHKSGARKATLTTRGKHMGRVEEKERRKSGIGYRKTGRSYVDDAYVASQKQAKTDAGAKKQKKKDDKAKAKKAKQENKDFQRRIMEKQIASGERKPQPKFL